MTKSPDHTTPRPRRRRIWAFRAAAILLPFAVLALLELGLRAAGAYEDEPWSNAHVVFEPGEPQFPQWPTSIRMPKGPRTYRIFTLGGSTVVGQGIPRNFSQLLEDKLRLLRPEFEVEVICGGQLAIGSHRVFEVMKEAAAYEPDLFLVYTGHNEFLEPIFFDPDGWVSRRVRLGKFANRLRTVRAIRDVLGIEGASRPLLGRTFPEDKIFPLIRSAEQYRLRLEFLRENLRLMIEFSRSIDCDLIVSPAVANLLCEPWSPVHADDCDRARCDELGARGAQAYADQDWENVVRIFETLHAEFDAGYALSHYFLGISLVHLGQVERGIAELVEANRLDRHGNRSNPDLRAAILEVCREAGVTTVDLHDFCHAAIPDDLRRLVEKDGQTVFYDHCHPTPRGHAMFAQEFLAPVLRKLDGRRR